MPEKKGDWKTGVNESKLKLMRKEPQGSVKTKTESDKSFGTK